MGRWAQRQRQGGTVPPINYMVSAQIGGSGQDQVTVQFSRPVSALVFNPASFQSLTSGEVANSVVQAGAYGILVTFSASLAGDAQLQYGAALTGFNFPQVIDY